jgi:hypothetical protein
VGRLVVQRRGIPPRMMSRPASRSSQPMSDLIDRFAELDRRVTEIRGFL